MIPRILEPEVMDSPDEATDYDSMDHAGVNQNFVKDFLTFARQDEGPLSKAMSATDDADPTRPRMLDVGTGTAQIPIELCRQTSACQIVAIDLAEEMLKVGRANIARAELGDRIELQRVDAKQLPNADGSFDAVISNSILHHIPQPLKVLAEMLRVLRPGGLLFVRDLLRPTDISNLDQLVTTYAGQENDHQRKMFRDSLHAALTIDEVGQLLRDCGQPEAWVRQTSDRHWTITGRK